MTIREFIVGLIGAFGLGSFLATIIQLYFENKRSKIERQSALNKEIYFKKLEAWERISVQIMAIDTEVFQWAQALIQGPVMLAQLNFPFDERVKELSVLQVWFSEEVRKAWNKINEPYNVIRGTYMRAQAGTMTTQQGTDCVIAITSFKEALSLVKDKIRAELDTEKTKIQ